MRFNKQELIALASQTSNNFDREGVLVLKEKQDGFFRRSEGCSVRWFRLRGNLLFYLKGPEQWYEPMGVIILGRHKINLQPQDENGHWPFQIVWDSGVVYKLATFHESERTLWIKSIQLAPYDTLHAQMAQLKEWLYKIRPVIDIAAFRVQKGIVHDVYEVPLYELALSCDNLLCDMLGRPPSSMAVVYLKYPKGPMVRYGSTEVVETCSNPSFSKTIVFRASDGLTGNAVVKIVLYDVKEMVSDTTVPIGFTALQLSMIQEAQRLRVVLQSQDKKTKGFITINGWSLEPSYSGASPSHNNNDKNSIEISQKLLSHRRSHSLPPKLGLKLKFPSYGSLFKQNFVNSLQVTYRFHSGLGGDITVHEIMAEPKICYQLPIQLLDIFIKREKDLLEGLVLFGDECVQFHTRQMELVSVHVSLLKHYCHARQSLLSLENLYFKASAKKDDPSLEFAPTNLHLQRMWVYNDTLNKTGFHDVITAGAFTAHTHKAHRSGGLIRLVQQVKDINDAQAAMHAAAANRIQAEYDRVTAVRETSRQLSECAGAVAAAVREHAGADVSALIEGLKLKMKNVLSLWQPTVIEETLSSVGWTKFDTQHGCESQSSSVFRLTEQLSVFHAPDSDGIDSSCSSKETSPTSDYPGLSSSVPNINDNQSSNDSGLEFDNEYFNIDRRAANHSFRSVRSPSKRTNDSNKFDLSKRAGSLRHDYKNTSMEQVSYKTLVDGRKKKSFELAKESLITCKKMDPSLRRENLIYLHSVAKNIQVSMKAFIEAAENYPANDGSAEDTSRLELLLDALNCSVAELSYWARLSHAALRLRSEAVVWTRGNAALQTRRDTCFSQALTTAAAGVLGWLCSAPHEVLLRLLGSGLGPLCGFEGLLSLHSTEKPMWGDMVVAVEDLQTVLFSLRKVSSSNSVFPQVSGSRGALTVHIPVSDSLYSKFASKQPPTFTLTAVLFNIGINDKASLAEALGETAPQGHSNCDNLERLLKYYHRYCKLFPQDPAAASRSSPRSKPLEEVVENLRIAVHKKLPKNVEVLQLAAAATRLMNGIRFTSCKSAKDRTGMSVTLEQCSILSSEYHLAEHEVKKALDVMRREGCRRENAMKNIGIRKFAFNKKQVMSLPEDYRPPPGTYGATQT